MPVGVYNSSFSFRQGMRSEISLLVYIVKGLPLTIENAARSVSNKNSAKYELFTSDINSR